MTLTLGEGRTLNVATATDLGCVRANNEDAFGVFPEERPGRGHLLLVADGMGGMAGGEVASRIAVDTVRAAYFAADPSLGVEDALVEAIRAGNRAVYEAALADKALKGMGTTLTAAVLHESGLWIGHVGDSRACLVSAGGVEDLTEEHTLATEMARQHGDFQVSIPAMAHHVLTRCLGVAGEILVDTAVLPEGVPTGAVLLLCSDGLSGPVDDAELPRAVLGRTPEDACAALVALAREAGGPDNVTVVVGG